MHVPASCALTHTLFQPHTIAVQSAVAQSPVQLEDKGALVEPC